MVRVWNLRTISRTSAYHSDCVILRKEEQKINLKIYLPIVPSLLFFPFSQVVCLLPVVSE